jgi:hypothetical protein
VNQFECKYKLQTTNHKPQTTTSKFGLTIALLTLETPQLEKPLLKTLSCQQLKQQHAVYLMHGLFSLLLPWCSLLSVRLLVDRWWKVEGYFA